jgi:hypothetical protein
VKIWMGQTENVSTRSACSAWRVGLAADETLGKPDRESLFADPARALEEKARRKRSRSHAIREPPAERVVSVEFDDWHNGIWWLLPGARYPVPLPVNQSRCV